MSANTKNDMFHLLGKVFGRIPVVEAKENLRLQPLPCDQEGADATSPNNCLLVHTARRMYGAKAAIFWKNTAYVDFIDEDGVRRVHRYINPEMTINQIRKFDAGEPFIEGRGLILKRPSKALTRKAQSKRMKKYYRTNKGKKQKRINALRVSMGVIQERLERAINDKRGLQDKSPDNKKLAIAKARIATEKEKLAAVKSELIAAKAAPVRNPTPRSYVFDLATRNGAAGNYRFVQQ